MISSHALQAALYAHLSDDTTLMNQISGVYDRTPHKTDYPFISFAESRVSRETLSQMEVETVTLALHLYSREQGRTEAEMITQRLFELLHNNANLNVVGYHLARLQLAAPETKSGKDARSYETEVTVTAVVTAI